MLIVTELGRLKPIEDDPESQAGNGLMKLNMRYQHKNMYVTEIGARDDNLQRQGLFTTYRSDNEIDNGDVYEYTPYVNDVRHGRGIRYIDEKPQFVHYYRNVKVAAPVFRFLEAYKKQGIFHAVAAVWQRNRVDMQNAKTALLMPMLQKKPQP